MFLKKANVFPLIVGAWQLNGVLFSCDKQFLRFMDFSDGAFNDGCLLIEKDNNSCILWEYYAPVLTHDARMIEHILKNTDSVDAMFAEIKMYCEKIFWEIEDETFISPSALDFSKLTQNETVCKYLAL